MPPMGRCAGVFVAVLLIIAAGFPMMFTLALRLPLMIPLKGCRVSTGGTGPGG